ncbi:MULTISPECIES: 50S ribosomal protein L24 [Zooshikella]|uniref:Large ribosomal subunit protein uL24 n=2 Tax=Zooshikella TaxID=202771 RepID=A0A4P9VTG5_9GAMM|nr:MULTISPECIES: 50S ribosomal protein L24 [Zooshikella]MBU2706586.1 50S ribosomal protein L24 [Zooshikella ganghwensis]MBU2712133.1 50S ribosomal protein L24 [Zooshikella harenae]RDH45967.1 50S ribosomal protein L24 [Zooshikella ganghwensis]
MRKIRSGDEVIVIAGKDKGKRGKVMTVKPDNKLIVSGINMVKRHTKPNPMLNRPGGIVEKEAAIHVSNVAIFNSETNKADRVGFEGEGKEKRRIFKSTGKPVNA